MFKRASNNRVNYDEYIEALNESRRIAQGESERLDKSIEELEEILRFAKENLDRFIEKAYNLGEFNDSQLVAVLEELNNEISNSLGEGIKSIKESTKKKQANLSNFTVTLFGRTKAGKSTIREALTNGNGESIGKGAQRTTRDVKNYMWNNLRIIDTPGISAYDGDDDVKIAEGIIDETDLILFLVTSDSIQESEFEKLLELKSKNKPIVILLNVKQAIDREIYLRKFLRNCNSLVSDEGQKGNIERIEKYCKKYLGNDNIKIIPIHAMAAFESTRVEDIELKSKLYNASRINKVKYFLRDFIANHGKQTRILTFRDDYIYYLRSLESIFLSRYKEIRPRIKFIRQRHKEIKGWFVEFKNSGNRDIEKEVHEVYMDLISEVDNFIDTNAGNKNIEDLWNNKIRNKGIEDKLNGIYKGLFNKAERYLNEFQRQINFEVNNMNFSNGLDGAEDLKKGILGKVARWGAVALDMVFLVSLTNWWNPAGWVAGVIGLAGIVLSVFTCVFGEDADRYDKGKSDAKTKMKRDISKNEKETKEKIKNSFQKNIINNLYKQINVELENNINVLHNYMNEIKKIALKIREREDFENKILFKRIYEETFSTKIKSEFVRISREQGVMIKVLLQKDDFLKNNYYRKILENVFGERIIYVEFTNDIGELLKRALYPAKLENVQFIFDGKEVLIKVEKSSIKQVIGKNGRNIRLTNRLLNDYNIIVEGI